MLQLQSAFGISRLLAIAWLFSERRARGGVEAGRAGARRHRCHRGASCSRSRGRRRLRLRQPGGRRDRRCDPRRHVVRVRLSRRRPPALRAEDARRRIRPRVAGAAGAAGDERAHHAAVLLAHPAAGGARLLLGAASAPSASAARSGLRPRPTSSSAMSRRRCSSAPISRG